MITDQQQIDAIVSVVLKRFSTVTKEMLFECNGQRPKESIGRARQLYVYLRRVVSEKASSPVIYDKIAFELNSKSHTTQVRAMGKLVALIKLNKGEREIVENSVREVYSILNIPYTCEKNVHDSK